MTISIEQAQLSLAELIGRTARGERVLITQDEKAVAELIPPGAGSEGAMAQLRSAGKGGVAAIFGKWPGDESDAEILAALAELS
jgi:antitoxin (DNA-binding transcriptional repressor) of toxin-antitoxin stability system